MSESPTEVSSTDSDLDQHLSVVMQDGRRSEVAEGEFRSRDGKLLFVRRGATIEIRCPRSKELYVVEWSSTVRPKSTASL
ncbi:MAG: hypothetical protein AAGA96_09455 [Verrucomicrobiota bacterium]